MIAHQVSHGPFPETIELVRMARIAIGAIGSASLPFLVQVGAALGLLPLKAAPYVGIGLHFVGPVAVVLLAARRTRLSWRQQLTSVVLPLAAGLVVVVVLIAGH